MTKLQRNLKKLEEEIMYGGLKRRKGRSDRLTRKFTKFSSFTVCPKLFSRPDIKNHGKGLVLPEVDMYLYEWVYQDDYGFEMTKKIVIICPELMMTDTVSGFVEGYKPYDAKIKRAKEVTHLIVCSLSMYLSNIVFDDNYNELIAKGMLKSKVQKLKDSVKEFYKNPNINSVCYSPDEPVQPSKGETVEEEIKEKLMYEIMDRYDLSFRKKNISYLNQEIYENLFRVS